MTISCVVNKRNRSARVLTRSMGKFLVPSQGAPETSAERSETAEGRAQRGERTISGFATLSKIKKMVLNQRELILYCIIGCSGVVIDYIAFAILTKCAGVHYQIANVISVSLGICNNFIWNAHFNFKVKDRMLLRFCSFYMVGMIGLGISAALLYIFIEMMALKVLISKLCIIFIVTIVQFLLNKFVTFRKRGSE